MRGLVLLFTALFVLIPCKVQVQAADCVDACKNLQSKGYYIGSQGQEECLRDCEGYLYSGPGACGDCFFKIVYECGGKSIFKKEYWKVMWDCLRGSDKCNSEAKHFFCTKGWDCIKSLCDCKGYSEIPLQKSLRQDVQVKG